jgi:FKBP-type peptidyl-prolyl cis-trans isomerase FklB
MYPRISFMVLAVLLAAGCSDTEAPETPASEPLQSAEVPETLSAAQVEAEALAAKIAAEKAADAEQARIAEESRVTGEAYLHINAQKPGVKVMASGLQFEIIESGNGRMPGPTSTVLTHYHGTFPNGEVFDSSVERGEPARFPVNRVIKGWTEALQMMKEGDIWKLAIPPGLAYGETGTGGGRVPPNTVLVYEVELIEVMD